MDYEWTPSRALYLFGIAFASFSAITYWQAYEGIVVGEVKVGRSSTKRGAAARSTGWRLAGAATLMAGVSVGAFVWGRRIED